MLLKRLCYIAEKTMPINQFPTMAVMPRTSVAKSQSVMIQQVLFIVELRYEWINEFWTIQKVNFFKGNEFPGHFHKAE